MSGKPELKIVVIDQSAVKSIVSDMFSLGMVGALFWFNYNFIGGSYFVNFIIFILCIVKVIHFVNGKKRRSPDEAIEYIIKLKGD